MSGTQPPRILADNFEKCDECSEIVLIHGRGECVELDDAVYCPRHARGRIDDSDWQLRWGEAMGMLETIRNNPDKAIKYHLAQGIGDRYIVHREDQIYEKWGRCEDDERNCTTTSESSVVRDIERRALVGSYVGYAPHIVDIDDAPINATVGNGPRVMADGGQVEGGTEYEGPPKRDVSSRSAIGECKHCGGNAHSLLDGEHIWKCSEVVPVAAIGAGREVVCLCGSTRFKKQYRAENRRLTMQGKIVLSVGLFGHADGHEFTEQEKEMLDAVHKDKIDIADRVHVINVDGYIGDSTQSEIEYAREHGKPVTFYEGEKADV